MEVKIWVPRNVFVVASYVSELLSKSNLPAWLVLVIILLCFAFNVYKRWLKHKETLEKEKTTRISKLVESLVAIKVSNNHVKNIRAITGKKETKVIDYIDFTVNKMQDQYMGEVVGQALDEVKNIETKESAPVCKTDKSKQINFPKKKKRSK